MEVRGLRTLCCSKNCPSLNWFLPTLALKSPPITNFSLPPISTCLSISPLHPSKAPSSVPQMGWYTDTNLISPKTTVTTLYSNHFLWPSPIHSSRACPRRTIAALSEWITATLSSSPPSHTTPFSSALISVINTISHTCLPISSRILRNLSLLCSLIDKLLTFHLTIFLLSSSSSFCLLLLPHSSTSPTPLTIQTLQLSSITPTLSFLASTLFSTFHLTDLTPNLVLTSIMFSYLI